MIDPYAVPALVAEFEKLNNRLTGRGRILIQNQVLNLVIRVMVEGDQQQEVDAIAII